jgi:hypothetical protein
LSTTQFPSQPPRIPPQLQQIASHLLRPPHAYFSCGASYANHRAFIRLLPKAYQRRTKGVPGTYQTVPGVTSLASRFLFRLYSRISPSIVCVVTTRAFVFPTPDVRLYICSGWLPTSSSAIQHDSSPSPLVEVWRCQFSHDLGSSPWGEQDSRKAGGCL